MPQHRAGRKYRGTHTTCTDLAGRVADIAEKLPEITGISLGLIQNGGSAAGGLQRVLIADRPGWLLLTVRQASTVQELRIFSPNLPIARTALARGLRDNGIRIAFRN
jgi:hypothetical protein